MASISSDETFFSVALITLYAIAPLTFLSLQFLQAPYGRHFRSGWGPSVPASVAWAVMESPTLFLTLSIFHFGHNHSHPLALLLISFFLFHYFHRTCIYPFYLKSSSAAASFPFSVALLAFLFNLLNAYLQGRWISHYAHLEESSFRVWFRILIGSAVFVSGFILNVRSDLKLIGLKKQGGSYKVPRGGMFELVTCPNYLGEALEWLGWALMTWSLVGLGFFLYTCANLVPRARSHRRWYLEKFGEESPRSRKAIIPFVY